MRAETYPASVAEYAQSWAREMEARLPGAMYQRPPATRVDPRTGSLTPVAGCLGAAPPLSAAGLLEAELTESERDYLFQIGVEHLLYLEEADVAHLGVSKTLFARIIIHMSERAFTRLVIGIARASGVLVHHCGRSICEGGPGFPDLVLAGQRHVLFAELKRPYGEAGSAAGWGVLAAPQVAWADRLTGCDRTMYVVWTPPDLVAIPACLAGLNDAA